MRVAAPVVIAVMACASVTGAAAQTPSAPASPTDVYHIHLTKAAPGQAAALAKELSQPDPNAPMPDHFVVLRHQEGDDWDYAVIQHLGQKPTITATAPPPAATQELRTSHTDTFVSGPSWADFTREMGHRWIRQAGGGLRSRLSPGGPGAPVAAGGGAEPAWVSRCKDQDRHGVHAAHRGQ